MLESKLGQYLNAAANVRVCFRNIQPIRWLLLLHQVSQLVWVTREPFQGTSWLFNYSWGHYFTAVVGYQNNDELIVVTYVRPCTLEGPHCGSWSFRNLLYKALGHGIGVSTQPSFRAESCHIILILTIMQITTSLPRPHFACLRTMEASEVTMEGKSQVLRCL